MLSAIANAAKSAQNCQNLPKFAQKTISLRNFGMPPKIEILVFPKNKNLYV
jgi:phage tail tube protein FII